MASRWGRRRPEKGRDWRSRFSLFAGSGPVVVSITATANSVFSVPFAAKPGRRLEGRCDPIDHPALRQIIGEGRIHTWIGGARSGKERENLPVPSTARAENATTAAPSRQGGAFQVGQGTGPGSARAALSRQGGAFQVRQGTGPGSARCTTWRRWLRGHDRARRGGGDGRGGRACERGARCRRGP